VTLNYDIQNSVDEAKISALFSGLLGSVSVGSLIAIFFSYYLIDDISAIPIWLGFNLIGGAYRLKLFIDYKKNSKQHLPQKWLKLFHYSTSYVATTWGFVTLLLLNGVPSEKEVVVVAIVVGLITGGVISNIASKGTAYYYSSSILLCYTVKTLILQGPYYIEFALSQVLFLALLFKMTKSFNLLYENAHQMSYKLKEKMNVEKELQHEKIKSLQSTKLASLGEMATGIAHEINNPLTIGIGKLQIIKKMLNRGTIAPEKIIEHIDSALESSRRIADIVLSMKNLSRIKEDVEMQEFSTSDLVNIVKPLYKTKLTQNKVKIIENFDDVTLYADKGEISQALLNLINNAIDAIKSLEGDRWIKLSTEISEDFVLFRITDCGSGIEDEDMIKFFEPFYTTKDVGSGTGLGLSLSKNIMNRNGGELIYCKESENTCFAMKIKRPKS
jgi:signal transduction histidine kinase